VRVGLHWWAGFVVVGLLLAASAQARADQLAVDGSGRAFEVTPSATDRSASFSSVRLRSAAPGGRFGPWRTVLRAGRGDRVMEAGVAADGSGLAFLQSRARPGRAVRAIAFGARGRVARPVALSRSGDDADFAASAIAGSGAAVVVWFRHRDDGRWRLEASIRGPRAAAFGPSEPLSGFLRRACCTSVSAAIGDRGDAVVTWSSTARPSVWAALRRPGRGFGRAQRLSAAASDAPRAVVGAGGSAAVIYSTQHVPLRASDGLQLHRATTSASFGAAEHVNPGGGVTIGDVAIAPGGDLTVAWLDRVHGARVHVSDARAAGPLAATAELGANVSSRPLAVDNDDGGRTVIAWSESAGRSERATAAIRPATGAPFGAPTPLGRPWRAAEPRLARLVPSGGALVLWKGDRYTRPTARRTALAVTRLP
jgi:hypothetical protein